MDLSVVVPVYNEEDNVKELLTRLVETLSDGGSESGTPRSYELVVVDDGSTDTTLSRLLELHKRFPTMRVVQLRGNFGQTAAMRAGFDEARGDVIVSMDGDLQNDPRDIPMMVDKLDEGYDLAAGWRQNRQDPFLTRKLPSKIANWIIAKVTGVPIHDNGCSLKAYRADVIREAPLYSELHRFIPAMVSLVGGRIVEVVVRHHPRTKGASKYGLSRALKVPLDIVTVKMLVAFSERPLHWFGMFSLATVLLSASLFLLISPSPVVATSLLMLAGFLATHLLVVGLVGELIVLMSRRINGRATTRIQSS